MGLCRALRLSLNAAIVLSLVIPGSLSVSAQTPSSSSADIQHWRKAYADELDQPDGWLALVALQWLPDGDTSVGSAPGNKLQLQHLPAHLAVFRQHDGQITLLAPPEGLASTVLVDGAHTAASVTLTSDDTTHPSQIAVGDIHITVIHRGDRYYLRIKDAYSPTRVHFRGLNWYAPNPRFRITAKWVPYTPAKTLRILNVLGQTSEEKSPGYAEFEIDGPQGIQTVKLDPLFEGDGLFFDFRDLTSRTTTDGAGRFLNTGLPSNGIDKPGTLIIDFNYAHNPPCGYTPYATCPLPIEGNRLAVAIPAGEKRYGD